MKKNIINKALPFLFCFLISGKMFAQQAPADPGNDPFAVTSQNYPPQMRNELIAKSTLQIIGQSGVSGNWIATILSYCITEQHMLETKKDHNRFLSYSK